MANWSKKKYFAQKILQLNIKVSKVYKKHQL